MAHKDMNKIFMDNEFRALAGNKRIRIYILAAILFFTLLGLGHSIGGLKSLKKRMNNPFTNWVNLPIQVKNAEVADSLINQFTTDSIKANYGINSVKGYTRGFLRLRHNDHRKKSEFMARAIQRESSLIKKILSPENLVFQQDVDVIGSNSTDCWIILKQDALDLLGYSDATALREIPIEVSTGKDDLIHYVSVAAVVKELPDLSDAVIPAHLDQLFVLQNSQTHYLDTGEKNSFQFGIQSNRNDSEVLLEKIKKSLPPIIEEDISTTKFYINDIQLVKLFMDTTMSFHDRNEIVRILVKDHPSVIRYDEYTCDIGELLEIKKPHYLSFNFSDLAKVRSLKNFVKHTYKLEISMNQVEDKENFSLVSQLTTIVSSLLFILSLLAIIIFLYSLLQNHLEKISVNLGTLKAFGLSNEELIKSYIHVILRFLANSTIIAVILALVYYLINYGIGGSFRLFEPVILLSLVLIYAIVYLISKKLLNNKLQHTPGDLIYQRLLETKIEKKPINKKDILGIVIIGVFLCLSYFLYTKSQQGIDIDTRTTKNLVKTSVDKKEKHVEKNEKSSTGEKVMIVEDIDGSKEMDNSEILNAITGHKITENREDDKAKKVVNTVASKDKKPQKAEPSELTKEILKDKLENSENKGKSCDDLIKEYRKTIMNIVDNPDDMSYVQELVKWNKDIVHNACLKSSATYSVLKMEIDGLLPVDEEEEDGF